MRHLIFSTWKEDSKLLFCQAGLSCTALPERDRTQPPPFYSGKSRQSWRQTPFCPHPLTFTSESHLLSRWTSLVLEPIKYTYHSDGSVLERMCRGNTQKEEAFQNELLIKIFSYTNTRVWHSHPGGDCILCGLHRVKAKITSLLQILFILQVENVFTSLCISFSLVFQKAWISRFQKNANTSDRLREMICHMKKIVGGKNTFHLCSSFILVSKQVMGII